jgi:phosphoribosylformylglycinamidine (FGAM) synthase-like enzyme
VTTDTGRLVLKHHGETVCDVPLAPLFDDAPLYDRPWVQPALQPRLAPADVPAPESWVDAVIKVVCCPDMASKRWIWEQYDRHVMADTLHDSATAADAGVVRVHGTDKGLAMTSDCTPRYVQADPYEGGKQAVAEAWRNLTAVGSCPSPSPTTSISAIRSGPRSWARSSAPSTAWPRPAAVLDFPVVSGNVSLYNETNGAAIPPTPTVGAVGLLTNYDVVVGFGGMVEGDVLVLIGETKGELGSSIYLREVLGREDGAPPPVDLALERRTGDFVREQIEAGALTCVHDLSDGGLIGAAADIALASDCGVELDASSDAHAHVLLFGEDQARYLVAVADATEIIAAAQAAGLRASVVGRAKGGISPRAGPAASCSACRWTICARCTRAGCRPIWRAAHDPRGIQSGRC